MLQTMTVLELSVSVSTQSRRAWAGSVMLRISTILRTGPHRTNLHPLFSSHMDHAGLHN